MTLTIGDVHSLVAAFEASDWDELTLTLDGETVQLSKTGRPPEGTGTALGERLRPHPRGLVAADGEHLPVAEQAGSVGSLAAASAPAAVGGVDGSSEKSPENSRGTHPVTAPSVGVFWRAPEPSAPPFVVVGQHVETTDPVCIVEVMKLFSHVQAGASGTVRSIEIGNGEMVEHGQTLFVIELDG